MQQAARLEPEGREPAAPAFPIATSGGRLVLDRLAGVLVRAGGFAVVLALLGILAFLLAEVAPLFRGAALAAPRALDAEAVASVALYADASLERVAHVGRDGRVRVLDAASGTLVQELELPAKAALVGLEPVAGAAALALLESSGRVSIVPLDWRVRWEGDERSVAAELGAVSELDLGTGGATVVHWTARSTAGGSAAAALLADGTLRFTHAEERVNEFSGERIATSVSLRATAPPGLARLVLDPEQRQLYGADASGGIFWWEIGPEGLGSPRVAHAAAPVTALALLVGGRSLVAGHADGSLSVWFRVRSGEAHAELVRAHVFASQGGAIRALAPSARKRSFAALGDDGELGLYHATSERTLWRGRIDGPLPEALAIAPRGDALLAAGAGGVLAFAMRNPHPEISLASVFGRTWYEDYAEPEFVWQSTGGSEEFESKLSLTPLVVGTLKGTFYALFFAIPLGILGALYTSQLMDPKLQRWVKPTVEIMASLPSVVLGFLAGLWLAPRLERWFPGVLLLLLCAPLVALAAGALLRALPARLRGRLFVGAEVALCALLLAGVAWASIALSERVEALVFGGDWSAFLLRTTGLHYDQRNAFVAGVAMAFAVIPIIFAIAEESLSNVPKSLTAASLALGATRWQTLQRVVLPAASPGLFAAVMIGFGRAVGETMIVLMATGNTPLLGFGPFDGFRSLSANIAVEIPEAPLGSTLYRTLFLSALLLFAVTFVLNTAADLVRERLRRRFASS